jgi:Sulfotransferase domain
VVHRRHPIIVLWTAPRSRSTAFERMMIERDDHIVFDEPFSARYYFSAERRSTRFETELPESTATEVTERLLDAAKTGPVFVKEMAYHASGILTDELLGELVNTFLVREPRAALASFAKKWPDLTEEEAGYGRLAEAFAVAQRVTNATPPVLEADDLVEQPSGCIRAWCDGVGIPFVADALEWQPGMQSQWELWSDWHEGTAGSSGFAATQSTEAPRLDARLEAIAARARPVYDELAGVRLAC